MERLSGIAVVFIMFFTAIAIIVDANDSSQSGGKQYFRLFLSSLYYFLAASIFNSLPLSLKNSNSRLLLRKALDDYYL